MHPEMGVTGHDIASYSDRDDMENPIFALEWLY
jgi:hypothetical protein